MGFLLVGMAWGLTTPFMRKGALSKAKNPQPKRPILTDTNASWVRKQTMGVVYAVVDLLKNPAYGIPLLLNVTGSVWFFLLIGQAGEVSIDLRCIVLANCLRIESHGTYHKLSCIFVYSSGRMVG